MKKYDLLKVLGISLLVIVLMSWVIPAGYYSNGSFTSMETIAPIGLYDIVRMPAITIATFIQYGILFLAIGGFYGVLNKTGVYSKLVDNVVDKWKKKREKFMIITVIAFALLSSVLGLNSVIFILVPFFVAVLLKLDYSKINALAMTVGSMLVGQIGTTLGFGTWGYLKIVFDQLGDGLSMFSLILVRIVLFVIATALYVLLIIKNTKEVVTDKKETKKASKENTTNEEEIPLYSKLDNKKGTMPLIIICVIIFVFFVIGVYNWTYTFNIDIFSNIYEAITTASIGGFKIFANVLGTTSEIGYWGNYDISTLLVIFSLVIGWVYSVKIKDIVDGFMDGMKQMLIPAIYGMLASIIFAAFLNLSGNFVYTIVNNFVSANEQFSLPATIGSAVITSVTYNDFYSLVSYFMGFFSVYDANVLPIIALIFQAIYGIVMVIAPTSIFLLVGLSYLNVSYKDWVKYIWKFTLIMFGVTVVISAIATMLS